MLKNKFIYKFAGLIIPCVIFISPSSPILLANSKIEDGAAFSIPLSLIILPFLLFWSFFRRKTKSTSKTMWFYILLSVFFGWMTILALYSSIKTSVDSYLYLFQWISPYLFIFFYTTIRSIEDFKKFLEGFFIGTMFTCSYVFLAGTLEFMLFGIGSGRMNQNVILPGFYQLYVYVPTVLAYSSLICICTIKTNLIQVRKLWVILLYFLSFFSILYTGAREGLLVYLAGMLAIYVMKNRKTMFVKLSVILLGVIILYGSKDYILQQAAGSDIMMFQKYARLSEKESSLAGRDVVIAKFMKVIDQEPIIGTAMLPANYHPYLDVDESSSAHNYYIDSYVWGGFFNFVIVVLLFSLLLFNCMKNILNNIDNKQPLEQFYMYTNLLLIIFILISNNINVPMRQPFTGAIGSFLIYCSLYINNISTNKKQSYK